MSNNSSTFSAAANLAKLCIGVGVLALPYSTSIGGLLFAPLVIAVVAAWNAVACTKMVECKNACAHMNYPANLSSTYSRIAYAGAGKVGVLFTDFSIIVTLLGVCIAYQITFAQLLQQIPYTNFSTSTLTILFGLLAIPLCCVPNVGVLAIFSFFGLICLIVSVVAIIVYGVYEYGSELAQDPFGHISFTSAVDDHLTSTANDSHTHLPLWPETLSSMSSFIGVATFCFGLCSLAFPVEESMRNKNEFGKAVVWSLVFVWFMYVLLGDLGAVLYVHADVGIKDNILSNLPTDSLAARMVRLAMTGVSLLTYPLTLVPPAQMIEHYILSNVPSWETIVGEGGGGLGVISSSGLSGRGSQSYGAVELVDVTDTETAGASTPLTGMQSDSDLTPGANNTDVHVEVSLPARIANRVTMVIMTTIIATWVPCFGMVIALLGGFTVTILSFILPSYLHLQIIGYNSIHQQEDKRSGSGNSGSGGNGGTGGGMAAPTESKRAREDRNGIIYADIALTVGGVLLCAVATVVTTIGFLSRVQGEGGQC